jgi:hypothetical protein
VAFSMPWGANGFPLAIMRCMAWGVSEAPAR